MPLDVPVALPNLLRGTLPGLALQLLRMLAAFGAGHRVVTGLPLVAGAALFG
jgi:hypothetical protein